MRNKVIRTVPLLLLGLFALVPCRASLAGSPKDLVHAMLEKVMKIQTDPSLQDEAGRDRRRAAIQEVILKNFNFEAMAREALGDQWGKLDGPARDEFKGIFQDLFGDSYTRLVLNFLKREKILYTRENVVGKTAVVDTTIYRTNEEIPVQYSLSSVKGGWLVRDVKIDGVSIVENYRRSFARVIQLQSYDSLLQKMRLQRQAIETKS
ncbi:MAG: ABC transporter substrate-binding protein [Desulfuromonadales bacterium]|jgi:phospholipid transport system substrate-binding protein